MDKNLENRLYITTLGQFSVRYPTYEGPGMITSQDSTSWRLLAFLQYLCVFHDRAVTQEEIFEILCNDIDSANPVNTIKTLLHRSRLLLEGMGFPDGKQVLRYRRGLYTWDPGLPVWLDIHEFDALCARFSAEPGSAAGLEAGRKALELYGGDFLPGAAGSPWTLSPRAYYHSKYLRLCFDMAGVLRDLGRLDEAIESCRAATALDPYDESCQLLMMQLLYDSGARQMALQHYSDVANLLMTQLGITPSEEMTALYRELSKTKEPEAPEMDLQTIRADLIDQERTSGPLFCEYSVFRDIYSLLVRSVPRSGQVVQLAVITLLDWEGGALSGERRIAAMEELHRAILSKLRSGDVFTQLSGMQYLLLLPTASYENGDMALRRVLEAYRRTVMGKTTLTRCSLISALSAEQQKLPEKSKRFAAAGARRGYSQMT